MRRRVALLVVLLAVLAWVVVRWTRRGGELAATGPAPADTATTGFRAAPLWFADVSGDSLVGESREIIEQTDLHERVATLVSELARGPSGAGVGLVPAETRVLHVYLSERGLMTLDLSGAFRTDFRGGSSAEVLAIAALARTLAANVPEVRSLLLVCEGAPIGTLAGHVPLDRPLDVAEWP